MAEFNLIVHGFVLIDEVAHDTWEICVPDMNAHAYMYGVVPTQVSPPACVNTELKPLTPGRSGPLTIEGYLPPNGVRMLDLISVETELVLKKASVFRTGKLERNVIRVPRPTAVRPFRGFEVPAARPVIQDPRQRVHAHGSGHPRLMYETAVFRYTSLPSGKKVSLLDVTLTTHPSDVINLNLYSQSPTDDGRPGGAKPGPHGDEVNEMLTFGGLRPTLDLASIAKVDGAHDTAIGISKCELSSLRELFTDLHLAEGVVCGRGWIGG